MMRVDGLLFGPLGAVILAAAIVSLPVMVPGYDPVLRPSARLAGSALRPSLRLRRSFAQ
jgi:hypothetical protein